MMSVYFTSLDSSLLRELMPTQPEGLTGSLEPQPSPTSGSAAPFAHVLQDMVGEANQALNHASDTSTAFARGEQNDLHGTMIALNQANIRLQLVNETRNHLLEAYREVMRMNV